MTSKLTRKVALVTGGAGFVGSHLCAALLASGRTVICLDNYLTSNGKNIEQLKANKRFTFVYADVTSKWFPEIKVDEVYNLACPASPRWYQADPIETMMINVVGTKNAMEWARSCGARFLQASTSEIYGDPKEFPQSEKYNGNVNPIGPRACYDEGKRAAESIVFDYIRHHDVDAKVVRIFNTYGPNMDANDGRVVSNFIVQALTGQSITVHGNGRQTRSFCYVSDLVRGIIAMMESNLHGPVNLGNPQEITMLELARSVSEIIGLEGELSIRFLALPQDDPKRRRPCIERAQNQLGWQPTVGLSEGLRNTIEYFKRELT